ncbi:MAG TPA: protein kinase [Streptosporangiaceae bacterium]|nr:protein kinase [Streptosporangiaceae bacterium]
MAALQADDPQRVGPYVLLGRLGSGGMGRVYLGRSPGGRQVAVKVIRPQLAEDDSFRARFAREVSAARKVGGLFTAQVVDADLDSPVPWLVTAYVPGASLTEAVEQQGPLPPTTVLALAAGLAEGLSAIHAAGVIHRDLKPSNVLLAPDGPRIIDFGISSAADAASLTGTGLMIGSPGFMSPEQAEGMPVGPSSDIFSLAGVVVFASRGEGAFGSGDTAALLYRVVHGTPNLNQVPDKIRPLISRCLSRSAASRPTAAEFLAELTAADPTAADLADWLPARLVELSAQRVADDEPVADAELVALDAKPVANVEPVADGEPVADVEPVADGEPVADVEPAVDAEPVGAQAYPAPRGYLGQAGPGQGPEQAGSGAQVPPPMPYPNQPAYGGQSAYPGLQGSQWYAPLVQPAPRRRTRWPWAVGAVAAVCAVIVAAVVLSLGSGHHAASAGSSVSVGPSSAAPSATATPTVGNLQLSQLRVGDCLTGANLDLNSSNPWPKLTLAVPCNQPHTAEVFLANDNFWPQNGPFPGASTISKDGTAACNNAFQAYVGITYKKSIYTWTNIIPDASTWPTGDRALHCVAYFSTPKQPAGATLTRSIKGSGK